MATKVAINGFGRIGRLVARAVRLGERQLQCVHLQLEAARSRPSREGSRAAEHAWCAAALPRRHHSPWRPSRAGGCQAESLPWPGTKTKATSKTTSETTS